MTKLAETLQEVRRRIERIGKRPMNEENTKATLIEPVLRALGWDVEDLEEVQREFKTHSRHKPVDYGLLVVRTPRLLIEAKALGENLGDHRWVNQIMGYASVAGVEWMVLTNGDEYRIYNTHAAVVVEEKLFRAVSSGTTAWFPPPALPGHSNRWSMGPVRRIAASVSGHANGPRQPECAMQCAMGRSSVVLQVHGPWPTAAAVRSPNPDQPGRPCRSPQDARSDAIARTGAIPDAGDVRARGRLHGPSRRADAACDPVSPRHTPSASNRAKSTQTSRGKGAPVVREAAAGLKSPKSGGVDKPRESTILCSASFGPIGSSAF